MRSIPGISGRRSITVLKGARVKNPLAVAVAKFWTLHSPMSYGIRVREAFHCLALQIGEEGRNCILHGKNSGFCWMFPAISPVMTPR